LQAILNSHPEVYISHESRIFAWLYETVNVLTARDDLVLTHRDEFRRHLREGLPSVIRGFYGSIAPGARYWGDKNPHYADARHGDCLELISELFPRSQYVHIVRDGRDVVASLVRQRNSEGAAWVDFEGAHRLWISMVERGRAFGQAIGSNRYCEIRYEHLVADDVAVTRELFAELGIPWDRNVEEFCAQQRCQRTPLSHPARNLEVGNVATSDWKTIFSQAEQERSLALLGNTLTRHGYEPR
jgi:hypothetical protein